MEIVRAVFRHPLLFPKKAGTALEEGMRKVRRVYGEPPNSWKVLHITCHPVAAPSRWLVLASFAVFWMANFPAAMKLRCGVLALAYSFMESCFTYFERGRAYTSMAQFVANLLYVPVLADSYGYVLEGNPFWYILLFPLNIWLLEIVQGAVISFIFGHNVAWCYADYADELCFGFIRVGHAIWWWSLGAVLFVAYPLIYAASTQLAGPG
mmetsp:Transcript_1070/g.2009  ORF Transcript_1070/g.2009 Transcript_1070/m.2009 type:complete len:209 (+) Transcript_1070:21-647(+)